MRFNFALDEKDRKKLQNLDEDLFDGFVEGFEDAMRIVEKEAKDLAPRLTGRLAESIRSGTNITERRAFGWVGSDVIYACIFDARTRITTDKGTKTIGQIRVGDKVLTQTGEFKKVTHKTKFPATEKPNLVKITAEWRKDSKHTVTVTDDHKILVYRDGRNKWVKAGELKTTDMLFDRKKQPHNNVTYSVCNPSIHSHVDLDTFRTIKILDIEKFTYEQTPGHASAYLYDLSVDDVHSFLANGIIVSNSIQEEGGVIRPKRTNYLRFKVDGKWRFARQVVIRGQHYLERAVINRIDSVQREIEDVISRTINRR